MDGNPQVILFDIGSGAWKLDEYKQELWEKASLGIPHPDIESNDAVILGFMICEFLSEVSQNVVGVFTWSHRDFFPVPAGCGGVQRSSAEDSRPLP